MVVSIIGELVSGEAQVKISNEDARHITTINKQKIMSLNLLLHSHHSIPDINDLLQSDLNLPQLVQKPLTDVDTYVEF